MLRTGIVSTSHKENERRVPIHPEQMQRIPAELRSAITLERGYGERFGVKDARLASYVRGFATREEILENSDVVILPKPVASDLKQIRPGTVFLGWPHAVQQADITQIAIDRRLTLIAMEAMYHWREDGQRDIHIFCKNNELAGYCGVFHALELAGIDGHFGPARRAVILSFGSCSRGAAYALAGRGFNDITIYTQRPPYLVQNQLFGYKFGRMHRAGDGGAMTATRPDGSVSPLIDVLAEADVIVNGILQDTDRPILYVRENEVSRLKPRCLIIDISCDLGMGFPFAVPTSFAEPTIRVGDMTYYAVDHTPSYLWDSASWNISEAMLPYLSTVMSGPDAWTKDPCIQRAVEMRDGVIQNPKILSFQRREATFPHPVRLAR